MPAFLRLDTFPALRSRSSLSLFALRFSLFAFHSSLFAFRFFAFDRHSRESGNPVTFAFVSFEREKQKVKNKTLDPRFRGYDEQSNGIATAKDGTGSDNVHGFPRPRE